MTPIDLITVILLAFGLALAIAIYILAKQKKLRPGMWPRILGIGALAFGFVSLMISSILLRPLSDLPGYSLTNCFWAILIGISGYISGRILEHRRRG